MKINLWCEPYGHFVDVAARHLGKKKGTYGLDIVKPNNCSEKRECGKEGSDGCLIGKRIEGKFLE